MYQFEQNNALATSFSTLYSKDKHNYQTRSATQNLLDVPLARTNKYGKESVKYQCVRDWNNFKTKFSQIPQNKPSNYENQKNSKTSYFWLMLNLLFTTINFFMCTLYYFYFLFSRVIQVTSYFMILLLLMFIVNRNFMIMNRQSYYRQCCCHLLSVIFLMLLLFALLLFFKYYYLLITILIYSLIYLFVY